MKLNLKAFALACGILWAVFFAALVILSIYTPIADQFVAVIGSVYYGVESTWLGALLGAVYAFVDAAIGAAIFVWLYNKLV